MTTSANRTALATVDVTPSGRGKRPTPATVRARRAVINFLRTSDTLADGDTFTARDVARGTRQAKARVALALRWLDHNVNLITVVGNYVPESSTGRKARKDGGQDRRQRPELVYQFADVAENAASDVNAEVAETEAQEPLAEAA